MNRRVFLRDIAGVAAAAGLMPARLAAAQPSAGADFTFVVLNDLHHDGPECDPWFARVVEAVRADQPSLCLLAGDLANRGTEASLVAIRDHFAALGCPVHAVPGNHDCDVAGDPSLFDKVFPGQANQRFDHAGWQFIGLDSTEGKAYNNTRIAAASLEWLRKTVRRMDRDRPTVVFTHFPMISSAPMAPLNSAEMWRILRPLNVRAVFCGHHHGQVHYHGGDPACTNVCCARVRDNHDGDPRKGYWVARAKADGALEYRLRQLTS